MVIYTIYPIEEVLREDASKKPRYFTMDMEGRKFVMEFCDGYARIVRLVSADPNDYLNPRWQPGTQVGFTIPSDLPKM